MGRDQTREVSRLSPRESPSRRSILPSFAKLRDEVKAITIHMVLVLVQSFFVLSVCG